MSDKKKICEELKKYNNRSGLITKSQIARFVGTKKPNARVYRLVKDLTVYSGRYYLVTDVAEAIARTGR